MKRWTFIIGFTVVIFSFIAVITMQTRWGKAFATWWLGSTIQAYVTPPSGSTITQGTSIDINIQARDWDDWTNEAILEPGAWDSISISLNGTAVSPLSKPDSQGWYYGSYAFNANTPGVNNITIVADDSSNHYDDPAHQIDYTLTVVTPTPTPTCKEITATPVQPTSTWTAYPGSWCPETPTRLPTSTFTPTISPTQDPNVPSGTPTKTRTPTRTRTPTITNTPIITPTTSPDGLCYKVVYPTYTPSPPFTVSITGISIKSDNSDIEATVQCASAGYSGNLHVELVFPAAAYTIFSENNKDSGIYQVPFLLSQLPDGAEYMKVVAKWTVSGVEVYDEEPYHFQVLGNYEQSCYTLPDEATCTGNDIDYNYTTGKAGSPCSDVDECTYQTKSGKSTWLNAIRDSKRGTGSGQDREDNIYTIEWFCKKVPLPRFRLTGRPCPQCSPDADPLTENRHVAVNLALYEANGMCCGEALFICDIGIRYVKDTGEGVHADQLDHYAGPAGCGVTDCTPPSDGRRTTIRLFQYE